LRSELRRMILAFATRTASVLDGCFFGNGAFASPTVGIIGNSGVAAVEPCSTGCMSMGPGDIGLRLGIADNALLTGWFVSGKAAAA
jgi:hypothetical protein